MLFGARKKPKSIIVFVVGCAENQSSKSPDNVTVPIHGKNARVCSNVPVVVVVILEPFVVSCHAVHTFVIVVLPYRCLPVFCAV